MTPVAWMSCTTAIDAMLHSAAIPKISATHAIWSFIPAVMSTYRCAAAAADFLCTKQDENLQKSAIFIKTTLGLFS